MLIKKKKLCFEVNYLNISIIIINQMLQVLVLSEFQHP